MGSPSPLDPQEHFPPPETPGLHDLSRSGSPPQATLDALVCTLQFHPLAAQERVIGQYASLAKLRRRAARRHS